MTALTAADLLAGPRGRRVLIELVDRAVAPGGTTLGRALDEFGRAFVEPGTRFVMRYSDDGLSTSRPVERNDRPLPDLVADVVAAVAAIPTSVPSATDLAAALGRSVDSAMYWEAPDDTDRLTAFDEVMRALTPIAEVVAATPTAAAWSAPCDRDVQATVDYRYDDPRLDVPGPPRPNSVQLAEWRERAIAREARLRAERSTRVVRMSSEWWSFPETTSSIACRGPHPAGFELVEDGSGWSSADARPVTVDDSARVAEIHRPADWARLCREHPLDVTYSFAPDWFRVTGRDGDWVVPDWRSVARDYDGVHLSVAGYLTSATRAIPVDGDTASMIAGWAPDATYWLTDAARVRDDAIRWTAGHDRVWRRS